MGIKIMIYNARLSFPTLGVPRYYQDKKQSDTDQRKWAATALVTPGTTKAQLLGSNGLPLGAMLDAKTLIDETLAKLAEEKWPGKGKSMLALILPDPKACCWIDGNRKDYEGYAGNWALTCYRRESEGRPAVLDSDRSQIQKLIEVGVNPDGSTRLAPSNEVAEGKQGRIYAGCLVNMQVELWAQKNIAGKGLRAGLLGVQRSGSGGSFGGGSSPNADAFGDVTEGAEADDVF